MDCLFKGSTGAYLRRGANLGFTEMISVNSYSYLVVVVYSNKIFFCSPANSSVVSLFIAIDDVTDILCNLPKSSLLAHFCNRKAI